MDGTLKITNNTLAYADVGVTSNPTKKYVDWATARTIPVKNPKSIPFTVDPGASVTLFSGIRTTSVDGTTNFSLNLSTLSSTRYRLAYVSGTNPGLRVARSLALNGHSVVVTVNADASANFTSNAADWSAVQPGDTILIPDTITGDSASPFNPLNVGYWTVLAVAGNGSFVQVVRPAGTGFIAYPETVAVASASQVLAFGATGIQVGDKVAITAGFSAAAQGTYTVVAATATYVEITATKTLPSAVTAAPGATGIQFYTQAKRWVRVEGDQSFIARWNGDTSNNNQIDPWAPADEDQTGWDEKCGPVFSAVVVNLSQQPLNLFFMSAE